MRPVPSTVAFRLTALLSLPLALAGCSGLSQFSSPSTAGSTLPLISGNLHGGQQPIAGAAVQLYAAGTSALKGSATPLLASTVLTDTAGNFSITGAYTCPTPTSLVYLVATGGDPGLAGSVNNTAIALMTAIGTCSSLSGATYLHVNELTTVVALEALSPFMADITHIGADPTNPTGLSTAFTSIASTLNLATGQLNPAPAGVTTPATLYSTLANILAACINTAGATTATSPCGRLFTATVLGSTTPTDTIAALINIVAQPNQNVALLFGLSTAISPFQPALAVAPTSFIPSAVIAVPVLPYIYNYGGLIAIDSTDQVWVYVPSQNPTTTIENSTLFVFGNDGALRHTIPTGSGGLTEVLQIAADRSGNVWALNHNHTLSKFNSSGTALSPATGFPVDLYVTSLASLEPFQTALMTIDPSGNVWLPSAISCFSKYSPAGANITPSGSYCTGANYGGAAPSEAIATDNTGGVFLSVGTYINSVVGSAVVHLDANGNQIGASIAGGGFNLYTFALAYDPKYSQLWGLSPSNVSATTGTILSAISAAGTPLSPANGFPTPPSTVASVIALDGAGSLWLSTNDSSSASNLNESDHTGTLVPGYTGLHPLLLTAPVAMAIDSAGTIWILNVDATEARLLLRVPGFAAGKPYQ